MLFLGTEKYPSEDAYSGFLTEHGGFSNAYTDSDDTNYFFTVDQDSLRGALDRFAQFFVAPLFSEGSTSRELHAVDNEHKKNLQSDGWRQFQLLQHLSDPAHAFNRFGTGDEATLNRTDIRPRLLAFHAKHYSANTMKLAVLGREPVDELKQWVTDLFAPINDTAAAPADFQGSPFPAGSPFSGVWVETAPVSTDETLSVTWQLFSTEAREAVRRSNPAGFVSFLLGHEGPATAEEASQLIGEIDRRLRESES